MVPNWLIILLTAALVLTIIGIIRRDLRYERAARDGAGKANSWQSFDGGDGSNHHHHSSGGVHDLHAHDGGYGHDGGGGHH